MLRRRYRPGDRMERAAPALWPNGWTRTTSGGSSTYTKDYPETSKGQHSVQDAFARVYDHPLRRSLDIRLPQFHKSRSAFSDVVGKPCPFGDAPPSAKRRHGGESLGVNKALARPLALPLRGLAGDFASPDHLLCMCENILAAAYTRVDPSTEPPCETLLCCQAVRPPCQPLSIAIPRARLKQYVYSSIYVSHTMPNLNVSELNIVLSVLGAFIVLYGIISIKIKNAWYLGEALPAVVIGIVRGPIASKFIDSNRWGSATEGQQNAITLGLCRVVIGVQLVIAGYQLPAKYQLKRWKEMLLCLLPIMTLMWLCTTGCILATIPKLTLLSALVIGSCVTCTDPILSQAIAKGPFADKYVARSLREIIFSEAGANDGFGFPFPMLATYLIRYADVPGAGQADSPQDTLHARSAEVGRLGGGVGKALKMWFVETWLKWIDDESYLLFPTALGLFIVGTCGALGTDDLLACFVAGNALNWDGGYIAETETRHDEVNSCVDGILNFGGFMYIGSILPWSEFHQPDVTGITYPRLFALGFLVIALRRIPSILLMYKLMPKVCKNWKDALFMGYFGPIGIGAVFYLEHARHLFPELGEGNSEETNLIRALGPSKQHSSLPCSKREKSHHAEWITAVYWLVLFSIVFHGLSIPALNLIYKVSGVPPVIDSSGPAELRPLSLNMSLPKNSALSTKRQSILVYNRFSRANFPSAIGWNLPLAARSQDSDLSYSRSGPDEPETLPLRDRTNMV
ncbi:hypothetical protein VTN00DRAFT_36 [Thermoascus crustaceus]|uniref:uncharacterized protein n=1 Tax=Thermoascus crustaceus TaxID=5088 RepID=UPI0037421C23